MKYNSHDKIKLLVSKFLQSEDTLIIIPYRGKKLNSFMDWKKIHFIPRLYWTIFWTQVLKLFPPSPFKNWCYELLGYKIGSGVAISPGAHLDPLYPQLISIEDNVIIGYDAKLMVHMYTHNEITLGRIHVGSNVLIGTGSLIFPGIYIGNSSAISAGSYVLKDVPDCMLVRGNPAKVVKKYNFKKYSSIVVKK